jgi:AraC-like DNA-binding protein
MQIQLLSNDRYPPFGHCVSNAEPGSWTGVADAAPGSHAIRITLDRNAIVILVTDRPASASLPDPPESNADRTLHVRITSAVLSAHLKIAHARAALHARPLGPDASIERLAQALIAAGNVRAAFDSLYVNAVSVAIVTRLIALLATRRKISGTGTAKAALPHWRLKRVFGHVQVNLGQPITLSDMAKAAGLTPMHFARQFRVATGIRPHEYLLRQRVKKAQELLRESDNTLVEVALSVGFQTQAHFTTVFKRFTGETPHRWRAEARKSGAPLLENGGMVPNALGDRGPLLLPTSAAC